MAERVGVQDFVHCARLKRLTHRQVDKSMFASSTGVQCMMAEIRDMYAALYGNELLSFLFLAIHRFLPCHQSEVTKRKLWMSFEQVPTQRATTSALGGLDFFWDLPFLC
jgi:hypothetical protein